MIWKVGHGEHCAGLGNGGHFAASHENMGTNYQMLLFPGVGNEDRDPTSSPLPIRQLQNVD